MPPRPASLDRPDLISEPDFEAWHCHVRELYRYWASLTIAGSLPSRQHIDPTAIPMLLPNLYLIDIEREPMRFRYRLVGSALIQQRGRELRGSYMDEAHPRFARDEVNQPYLDVAESSRPSWRKGPTALDWGGLISEIECLLLPLAADRQTPDYILGMSILYDFEGRER